MAKRDPNQPLLDALRNPLRRSLLRRHVESKEMLSPKELAKLEKQSLSGVSYHVRVRQVWRNRDCGGAAGARIRPALLPADRPRQETPWVLATLGLEG